MTIHVEARGRTAAEVEQLAVLPVERALVGAGRILATSTQGRAVVTVELEPGADIWQVRSRISDRLVQTRFPDDVHVDLAAPMGSVGVLYVLRSDRMTTSEVRTAQDWLLRPQLLAVAGVSDVVSCGGGITAIEVAVMAERLRALDITVEQVKSALSEANDSAGGGYMEQGSAGDFIVRGGGARLDDLDAVQIDLGGGQVPVRLRDIAEIRRRDRPAPCQAVLGDGTAIVSGSIALHSAATKPDIEARMDELRAALPEGMLLESIHPDLRFRLSTLPSDDPAVLQRLAEGAARTAGHADGVARAIALIGNEPDGTDRSPGEIEVLVELAPQASPTTGDAILALLRAMPGVAVRRPDLPPSSRVRLEIGGPDRASLADTATELHRLAAQVDDVEAVVTLGAVTLPRTSIVMDRGRMAAVGITPRDVTDAVELASDGTEVGFLVDGIQQVPIEIRWSDVGRDPQELGGIPLRASNGSWLMLHDVARFELEEAQAALLRSDGAPVLTVWIEVASGRAERVRDELRRRMRDLDLPVGQRVTLR